MTMVIGSCKTPLELLILLQHHSPCLNEIHLSASLLLLAKWKGKEDQKHASCTIFVVQQIQRRLLLPGAGKSALNQPRFVANVIWSCAKLIERFIPVSSDCRLTAKALKDLSDLSSHLFLHNIPLCISQLNPQHVSNSAYALTILARHEPAHSALSNSRPLLLGLILNRSLELFDQQEFKEPQAFANLLYSLSSLNHSPDPGWMDQCLDACEPVLPLFEPMHISSALSALANLSFHPGQAWLGSAMRAVQMKVRICSPQSLVNILWVLAKMGCDEDLSRSGCIEDIMDELVSRSSLLSTRDCSNALWSMAKIGFQGNPLHIETQSSLIHQMARRPVLSNAVPQDISNALWAVSVLRPKLSIAQDDAKTKSELEAIAARLTLSEDDACECLMSRCRPQEVSNIALAAARLGLMAESSEWWQSLFESTLTLLQPSTSTSSSSPSSAMIMQPQHISNVMWSAARSRQHPSEDWLLAALDAFNKSQGEVTGQAISCVLWSIARMGHLPPPSTIEPLLSKAVRLKGTTDQGLSMILWSVASLTRMEREQRGKRGATSSRPLLLRSSLSHVASAVFDRVGQLSPLALVICLRVLADSPSIDLDEAQKTRVEEAACRCLPHLGMRELRSIIKTLLVMRIEPGSHFKDTLSQISSRLRKARAQMMSSSHR